MSVEAAELFITRFQNQKIRWISLVMSLVDQLDREKTTPEKRIIIKSLISIVDKIEALQELDSELFKEINQFIEQSKKERHYWTEILTQELIRLDGTEPSIERKNNIIRIDGVLNKLDNLSQQI